MQRKTTIIVLGIITIIFTCVFITTMALTTGLLLTQDTDTTDTTIRSRVLPPVAENAPPETNVEGATLMPPSTTNTPPATAEAMPNTTIVEATPTVELGLTPLPTPSPTPAIAQSNKQTQVLNLPAGSVNALNQEGIATKLVIPKLELDAPITLAHIENGTWQVDHLGETWVGHLEGTARAGDDSNIVLAAHVTVRRGVYGPFAGLSLLKSGDEVIVYEGEQAFRYKVRETHVVDRTAVDVTYPSDKAEITLITCSRWSQEDGRYLDRLVVKGDLVE